MKGFLLVLSLLIALCTAVPTQLSYTIGTNYVYNVSGIVQNNGYDTNVQDYVPGYYSYMNAYMVMQPVQEDDTAYLFVMNLFGTVVSVSNTTGGGSAPDNNGESLGEDMYFTQLKTGEITEIQYYSDDPIYYVDVKLGAINAFQTSIVSVTGPPQTVLESDPIGNHSALISAVANSDGSVTLTKTFSQVDFSAFPDPTVTPQNMNINAQAVTTVHAEGYVSSSNSNQAVVMTSGAPSENRKRAMTNSTGFDMDLSALGSLSVQFAPNDALMAKTFSAKKANYVAGNMFDYAVRAASIAKNNAFTMLENPISILLSKERVSMATLTKIGNHFTINSMDLLIPLFTNDFILSEPLFRDRLFFVLTVAKNEEFLIKYGLNNKNCDVVNRAVLAAAHFLPRSRTLSLTLENVKDQTQCGFAQATAKSVLYNAQPLNLKASDFPYNKSYSVNANLGGKTAAVDFSANVFAGTNLNCNNPSFNFEGSAEATATVVLFGASQQAFDAKVIYGQENGQALADSITLSIWGNPVYNQPIPEVPCESGNYPLAHATPGFSVSHTLWVSIIPIVFSASVSLDLTATWGWNVCPNQLSADVDISGDGAIEVTGSTYTDLLLLRAGFELDGTFQTDIVPTVSVSGTSCQISFEVDADNQPMSASLTSYYEWRQCKFLFFDCKWGNHNQQTWWQWAAAAKDYVLYKISYKIGS